MDSLKKVDFLGEPPSFQYQDQKHYSSIKGGIMSLFVLAASTVCVYFFGVKLIASELDSATFAKLYQESPPEMPFEQNNFAFYFGIQDRRFLHVHREDLFSVNFSLRTRHSNATSSRIELKHKKCELADFGESSDLFASTGYNNAYCLGKEEMSKVSLNSAFGHDDFKLLAISVRTCKNTTESSNCAPQEEIDSYADGFFFDMGFAKDIVDPNNFSNPAKKYYEDYFSSASQNFRKTIIFYFRHILVDSDVGWVFEQNTSDSYFDLGSIKENLELRQTDEFLQVLFRLHKETSVWTRKYFKLQHFVAQLGGVLKGLVIFAKIMMYPFSETEMMVGVMNSVLGESSLRNRLTQRDASMNESRATISSLPRSKVKIGFLDAIIQILPFFSSEKKRKIANLKIAYKSALNVTNYVKMMTVNSENLDDQGKRALKETATIKFVRA